MPATAASPALSDPDALTDADSSAHAHPHPDTHPTTETHAHAPGAAPDTHTRTTATTTGAPAGTTPPDAHADPAARPGSRPARRSPTTADTNPDTVGRAHSTAHPQPGQLSALPGDEVPRAAVQRGHVTRHLRPAHHRARGDRRRRAAAPLAPILEALLPEWLVLTLAMAAACAVVVIITIVRHRTAPEDEDPNETPDVIEYMTMWIGVVYAIVLGLAIAGVWEARSTAQDHVQTEAQALHEISERVRVYPPDVRDRIRDDVNAYVGHVVTTEWKAMADRKEVTERGGELLEKIRIDVTDYEPRTDFQAQAYQPLLDQVAAADEARNARADSTGATMPGVVWFGLLGGGAVTIGMVFALQIRRTVRELVLAGLFSALIAFLLFLIWAFDTPYSHSIAASAEPFLNLFPDAKR